MVHCDCHLVITKNLRPDGKIIHRLVYNTKEPFQGGLPSSDYIYSDIIMYKAVYLNNNALILRALDQWIRNRTFEFFEARLLLIQTGEEKDEEGVYNNEIDLQFTAKHDDLLALHQALGKFMVHYMSRTNGQAWYKNLQFDYQYPLDVPSLVKMPINDEWPISGECTIHMTETIPIPIEQSEEYVEYYFNIVHKQTEKRRTF